MKVLKLGGELIETAESRAHMARLIARLMTDGPLVVIHGGGKAVDVDLKRRQIEPKKVDGLRITDADTLESVIAVIGGSANMHFVASLVGAGLKAVGLSGVDASCGRAVRTAPITSTKGEVVDLGLVGDPTEADPALFRTLTAAGYLPVVACLGVDDRGQILNVNADVMACRIAAAVGASELLIAGTTAGVFDASGATIPQLDTDGMAALIASGAANAGMVAKLNACRTALDAGVAAVKIVDGKDLTTGTTLVAGVRA